MTLLEDIEKAKNHIYKTKGELQWEKDAKPRHYFSENGSLMPNKFLKWRQIPIDRPTPLLDGTEFINEEGFRMKIT